ncbi:MAG: heme-binding domain-containing protein [bacterium]|jgi:mono/diheme cytochrome c family protein
MKYLLNLIFIIFLSAGFLAFCKTPEQSTSAKNAGDLPEEYAIPENVKTVIDRSCMPCHGPDGKFKAKLKWNYEKMNEYDKTKMISKLAKITEVIEDEEMPPPKQVKKNPELKLSDGDKKILTGWAENTAESLTGSNE